MKKKKSYKFYYVIGTVVIFVSLFVFSLFITLPLAIKDMREYLGWISLIVSVIAFLGIIYGIYLIKKGKFIKLNNK